MKNVLKMLDYQIQVFSLRFRPRAILFHKKGNKIKVLFLFQPLEDFLDWPIFFISPTPFKEVLKFACLQDSQVLKSCSSFQQFLHLILREIIGLLFQLPNLLSQFFPYVPPEGCNFLFGTNQNLLCIGDSITPLSCRG